MEVKREADSSDATECPQDEKLSIGMWFSSQWLFLVFCVSSFSLFLLTR